MQVSLIRQTPVASILMMLLIVAVAFTRFAISPYGDELIVGDAAMPAAWADHFQSRFPILGNILSALVIALTATSLGRMASALGLYQTRTTVSIPLYAIVSCGIFIACDSLAVSLSALTTTQLIRCLCGIYVRGTDLNHAFYAGICACFAPLFYTPAIVVVLLLPIAIFMFGLSWREVVVMVCGLLLPITAICYINWLLGGEFSTPLTGFYDAITNATDYRLWDSESVVALTTMGLLLFAVICSIIAHIGAKRSLSIRPRTILDFNITAFVILCTMFAIPSATVGALMLVALPAVTLMPIALLRTGDGVSNMYVILLIILVILHLFIA